MYCWQQILCGLFCQNLKYVYWLQMTCSSSQRLFCATVKVVIFGMQGVVSLAKNMKQDWELLVGARTFIFCSFKVIGYIRKKMSSRYWTLRDCMFYSISFWILGFYVCVNCGEDYQGISVWSCLLTNLNFFRLLELAICYYGKYELASVVQCSKSVSLGGGFFFKILCKVKPQCAKLRSYLKNGLRGAKDTKHSSMWIN